VNRSWTLVLAVLLFCGLPGGGSAEPREERVDGIIALVNGEPITLYELQSAIAPYQARLRAMGSNANQQSREQMTSAVLEGLIDDMLVLEEARRMQIDVPREQVEQQISRLKETNGWSDAELEQALMMSGIPSLASYREHLQDELLRNQVIGFKVTSRVKIDDKEVERGYAREVKEGRIEERRASHILLLLDELASDLDVEEARKKLGQIRERILSGESSFQAMAREHSGDPTGSAGGDLGWFSKGNLDPSFETAVWTLEKGQMSEPVRTPFGVHLIMTTGVRQKQLADESQKESMLQQIRYRLRETEMKRLYGQWLQTLREEAFIEIRR